MPPFKTILIRALILAIILTAPLLFAENGTGIGQLPENLQPPSAERTSMTRLNQQKAATQQGFRHAQMSDHAPAGAVRSYDIYRHSTILQHGNNHTLLPDNALIHIPDSLQHKVVTTPRGTFIPWPRFYLANRSWIFTHEINLKQAEGTSPLKEDVLKQFVRINRIVVALHQNNPISILRPGTPAKVSGKRP
ncbi:MAG: hypothetical protein H7A51_19145 [Akkermansiaceae bacterium]|nr:hypothetical protein [Akkermansiaceae bacterium]